MLFMKEHSLLCPCTVCSRGAGQTLSPRLPGSSWQLTADYQTWGHCITASIFPLGKRIGQGSHLCSQEWCVLSITTLPQSSSCGALLIECCLNQAQPPIPHPIFFTDPKYCFAIYSGILLLSFPYHKEESVKFKKLLFSF